MTEVVGSTLRHRTVKEAHKHPEAAALTEK